VIGEIPLNAFAFRLFHEPDVLTYAMTVTVAVGLVLLAHGLGLFLSRPERNRVWRLLVGVFVMGIIINHINREFASVSTERLSSLKE